MVFSSEKKTMKLLLCYLSPRRMTGSGSACNTAPDPVIKTG